MAEEENHPAPEQDHPFYVQTEGNQWVQLNKLNKASISNVNTYIIFEKEENSELEHGVSFYVQAKRNQTINTNKGAATNMNVPRGKLGKNREAFRELKVHKYNGHEFVVKYFTQPAFCSFCNEFLW